MKHHSSDFSRLVEACKRKEPAEIRRLLGRRPELLVRRDRHERTLLHYVAIRRQGAADSGNEEDEEADAQKITAASGDRNSKQALASETDRCLEAFNYLIDQMIQGFKDAPTTTTTTTTTPRLWRHRDLDGLTLLHLAVISCNSPLVRLILIDHKLASDEFAPLVRLCDNEHHSPLHWAVITNNLESVRLLVARGGVELAHLADLNGASALHYATQTNDYPKYRQQLRQMLNWSTCASSMDKQQQRQSSLVSVDAADGPATQGATRKQASLDTTSILEQVGPNGNGGGGGGGDDDGQPGRCLEILDYLVKLEGINLECLDNDRRTPLLWAASSGNRGAIRLLLRHGANFGCQDSNRLGALHCAASHGYTDCLECLLSHCDDVSDQHQTNNLLNQPDNLSCSPLFYAVLSGNIDCVELLADRRGCQLDWQDVKGRTAAHFAALKGQLSTLKLLGARGANLWLANKQGDLALHYAIKSGRQQVVAWLLEHSPYERAVNAINNLGRAPIHLAVMKNNRPLVEYLIASGANLNQLVKVRDSASGAGAADSSAHHHHQHQQQQQQLPNTLVNQSVQHQTRAGSMYHYETALDMAKRLGHRDCLDLLERNSAQSAATVLIHRLQQQQQQQQRQQQLGAPSAPAGNSRSIFDLQAVDVASPIGFETSSSSAEPQSEPTTTTITTKTPSEQQQQLHQQVPRVPAAPRPLEQPIPQSDSTGSSALSQCSLTSLRYGQVAPGGLASGPSRVPPAVAARQLSRDRTTSSEQEQTGKQPTAPMAQDVDDEQQRKATRDHEGAGQQRKASTGGGSKSSRPYRGGISYHNDHINASIKCKLYESTQGGGGLGSSSFPPLGGGPTTPSSRHHSKQMVGRLAHSSSSLTGGGASGAGQQEIITNVNVYTSPCSHCYQSLGRDHCTTRDHRSGSLSRVGKQSGVSTGAGASRTRAPSELSTSSGGGGGGDSSTSSSEMLDETNASRGTSVTGDEDEEQALRPHLADLTATSEAKLNKGHDDMQTPPAAATMAAHHRQHHQQHHHMRYLPPSQGYEQHLPAILSAEEERSTSGETVANHRPDSAQGLESPQLTRAGHSQQQRSAVTSPSQLEPRFDRTQRGGGGGGGGGGIGHKQAGYHQQVRSPVADYIHSTPSGHPSYQQHHHHHHQRPGDWYAKQQQQQQQQQQLDYSQVKARVDSHRNDSGLSSSHFLGDLDGNESSSLPSRAGHRSRSFSQLNRDLHQEPGRSGKSPTHLQQLHQQQRERHRQGPAQGGAQQRQTIIRTRRLSVDSVELASRVEKSIRKYRQETKLFEELQNLKRSQIRSGRANEALLVKRLVEHFRHEAQQDSTLIGLDQYRGPYTYQSYELYLYDQLRKLSQSNCAKLAGNLAAAAAGQQGLQLAELMQHQVEDDQDQDDQDDGRDYLEEDLRAELELQRVINSSEMQQVVQQQQQPETANHFVASQTASEQVVIEPKEALEEIRVRSTPLPEADQVKAGDQFPSGQPAGKLTSSLPDSKQEQQQKGLPPTQQQHQQTTVVSSASSSRRSSVDIERDKLLELPLQVKGSLAGDGDTGAQQQQSQQLLDTKRASIVSKDSALEDQASSLSSMILVDALGNVSSRASSPSSTLRKQSQPGDTKDEEEQEEEADKAVVGACTEGAHVVEQEALLTSGSGGQAEQEKKSDPRAEADSEEEEEEADEEGPSVAPPAGRPSRRMSVVNIGNKMEVIYHDVGIEIGPLTEGDHHSEDEEGAGESHQKEDHQPEPIEAAEGEQDGGSSPGGVASSAEPHADEVEEPEGGADTAKQATTTTSEIQDGYREATTPPRTSGDPAAEQMSNSSQRTLTRRRASSPQPTGQSPAAAAAAEMRGSGDQPTPTRAARSMSMNVIDRPQAAGHLVDPEPQRKVFTGHDLDELHSSRSRSRSRSLRADADDGPPAAAEPAAQLQDSRRHSAATTSESRRPKTSSPTFRRHLARSRPPRGPFKVEVRMEEIRARWRAIKRRGRCLRRAGGGQGEDADWIGAPRQPTEVLDSSAADEQLEDDNSTGHFTLIYELNKHTQRPTGESGQQQQPARASGHRWCQRRVTRIVDVRTLKRTISLPESLIYSNDLLKRFNILKL